MDSGEHCIVGINVVGNASKPRSVEEGATEGKGTCNMTESNIQSQCVEENEIIGHGQYCNGKAPDDQGVIKENGVQLTRNCKQILIESEDKCVTLISEDVIACQELRSLKMNDPHIGKSEVVNVFGNRTKGTSGSCDVEEPLDSVEAEMISYLDHFFAHEAIVLGALDFARSFTSDSKCDRWMQMERLKSMISLRAMQFKRKGVHTSDSYQRNDHHKDESVGKHSFESDSEIEKKLPREENFENKLQSVSNSAAPCQHQPAEGSNSSYKEHKEKLITVAVDLKLTNGSNKPAKDDCTITFADLIHKEENLNAIGMKNSDQNEATPHEEEERKQIALTPMNTVAYDCVGKETQTYSNHSYVQNILMELECPFKWKPNDAIKVIPNARAQENMIEYLTSKEQKFARARTNLIREIVTHLVLIFEKSQTNQISSAIKDLQHCYNILNTELISIGLEHKGGQLHHEVADSTGSELSLVSEDQAISSHNGEECSHNISSQRDKISNERVVETLLCGVANSSQDLLEPLPSEPGMNEEYPRNAEHSPATSSTHEKTKPSETSVTACIEANTYKGICNESDSRSIMMAEHGDQETQHENIPFPTQNSLKVDEHQSEIIKDSLMFSDCQLKQQVGNESVLKNDTGFHNFSKSEKIMNQRTCTQINGRHNNVNQVQELQAYTCTEAGLESDIEPNGGASNKKSCTENHNMCFGHTQGNDIAYMEQDIKQQSNDCSEVELKAVVSSSPERTVTAMNVTNSATNANPDYIDDDNRENTHDSISMENCTTKNVRTNQSRSENNNMYQWPKETDSMDCFASCNMREISKQKPMDHKVQDKQNKKDTECNELLDSGSNVEEQSSEFKAQNLNRMSEAEIANHRARLDVLQYIIKACLVHIAFCSGECEDALAIAQELQSLYKNFNQVSKATVLAVKALVLCEYGNAGNKLALPILMEALHLDPSYWEWYLYCGKVMGRVRRVEKSAGGEPDSKEIQLLEKAVSLHKQDAASMVYLANIYRILASISHRLATQEQNATSSSVPYVQSRLEGNWRNSRGSKYQSYGNSKDSQRWQTNSRPQRNVEYSSPYLNLAKKLYRDALKLEPHCPYNNARCAKGLWSMPYPYRDNMQAQEAIVHAQALAQDDTLVNHYSGMFYEHRRDFNKALACYERAIRGNNNYPAEMSYINIRMKMASPGNYSPVFHLDSLMNKYTTSSYILQTHCMRAFYLYKVEKQLLQAIHYFCKAIRLDPTHSTLKTFYPGYFYGRNPLSYNIYELLEGILQEFRCSKAFEENKGGVEDAWQTLKTAKEKLHQDKLAIIKLAL